MATCPTCARAVDDALRHCPHDGTRVALDPEWQGRVLDGRYRILSLLGEGGMGTVYLAEHVVLGKQMAVKVLRQDLSRDEELVKRFQQEAIAASQIGQENIVNITDFGRTEEGALYFVMERLLGRSLHQIIQQQGPLPVGRAVGILVQICKALAAAHARGIVHRDLKPENVILQRREDGSDFAKVLDFGISKVGSANEGGQRITRVGVLMGTPEYMAPEQVDAPHVDHRVDIYALGVLAYEVLTGMVPFTGNSPMAILIKHQTVQPDPPSHRRAGLSLPPGLEALILRMLSKRPEDRPQSMAEVASSLAGVMPGMWRTSLPPIPLAKQVTPPALDLPQPRTPIGARGGTLQLSTDELRTPPLQPGAEAPRPRIPTLVEEPTVPGRPSHLGTEELAAVRRRSPLGWIAGVIVLLLGAVGGTLLLRSPDAPPPAPVVVAKAEPLPRAEPPAAVEPMAAKAPPVETPPPPTRHKVVLASVPDGAKVWSGDQALGTTPLEVELTAGDTAEYRFTLEGHASASQTVAADAERVTVRLQRRPVRRRAAPAEDPFRKIDDLKENPFQ